MNYYNDSDASVCTWLKNLMRANLIPPGVVDNRSIVEVSPSDLIGFTQCHFFAGIGGWSRALQLVGLSTQEGIWTGSCPCQPFSSAGKNKGFDDERHLWPSFFNLIKERRPAIVFGEQVAGKSALPWMRLVQNDCESENYRFAAASFPACSVGAPHIRQRNYWVADTQGEGLSGHWQSRRLALQEMWQRTQRHCSTNSLVNSYWKPSEFIFTRDGKARPIEPGLAPMVDGVSQRVVRIRAYGNAIVPQQASIFIKSAIEAMNELA